MSVVVNYKGEEILSADTDVTKILKTSGKYCEDDIEIVNTQDGGVNPLLYASGASFYQKTLPAPNEYAIETGLLMNSYSGLFRTFSSQTTSGSKLKVSALANVVNMSSTFRETQYETIEINYDTGHVTDWSTTFSGATKIKYITGVPLDFSSATSTDRTFGVSGGYSALYDLVSVRFKPNTLSLPLAMYVQPFLDSASLVSLANCLVYGSNTLTLHGTLKTNAQNIYGTVSQVTVDDVTYDFFTASSSGTVTLENFITQTKGWTIA